MATKRHDEVVGSEKVARATGRSREEWFELLDAASATGWSHRQIAEWLVTEHDVDGWWAQSLTVGYEQARGMRQPGQRPDGTFDANVSKTCAAGAERVFAQLTDDALRTAWLDDTWQVASASAPKRVRLESAEASRVVIEVTAVSPERTRVAVQHGRLPDAESVGRWKDYWRAALGRLADTVA